MRAVGERQSSVAEGGRTADRSVFGGGRTADGSESGVSRCVAGGVDGTRRLRETPCACARHPAPAQGAFVPCLVVRARQGPRGFRAPPPASCRDLP